MCQDWYANAKNLSALPKMILPKHATYGWLCLHAQLGQLPPMFIIQKNTHISRIALIWSLQRKIKKKCFDGVSIRIPQLEKIVQEMPMWPRVVLKRVSPVNWHQLNLGLTSDRNFRSRHWEYNFQTLSQHNLVQHVDCNIWKTIQDKIKWLKSSTSFWSWQSCILSTFLVPTFWNKPCPYWMNVFIQLWLFLGQTIWASQWFHVICLAKIIWLFRTWFLLASDTAIWDSLAEAKLRLSYEVTILSLSDNQQDLQA